jgi:hypothetical protein
LSSSIGAVVELDPADRIGPQHVFQCGREIEAGGCRQVHAVAGVVDEHAVHPEGRAGTNRPYTTVESPRRERRHGAPNARTALGLPATPPVQIATARDRQIWRGECHSTGGRYAMYGQPVLRLVRFALLAVLAFLVLGLVVALGSPQTGPIEKAVLALAIVGLLAAGVPVRRIGLQA